MSISEKPTELSSSAPPSVPRGSFPNAPYWLIVGGAAEDHSSRSLGNRQNKPVEVLSLDLADGGAEGSVLPVFGSEEGAARFARAWTQAWSANAAVTEPVSNKAFADSSGNEWRPRGTGVGELISLLSGSAFSAGPCGGVERVTLDPPPELIDGLRHDLTEGHVGELVSMSRRCFLERLMGRGRPWFENRD